MTETHAVDPSPRRRPGPKPRNHLLPIAAIAAEYQAASPEARKVIREVVKAGDMNAQQLGRVITAAGQLTAVTTALCLAMLDALDAAEVR